MASDGPSYEFDTLLVQRDSENPKVLDVAINRPEKLNAMNHQFWLDMKRCMETANQDPDVHCVVIHGGSSRIFTAGLDLQDATGSQSYSEKNGDSKPDPARRGLRMDAVVKVAQDGVSCVELCRKPVVVAMHSAVIGGGIDLACAADIRYCSGDAYFSIAEVNVGLAADVGTLQRMPKKIGNDSIMRELALTGRKMLAVEAQSLGLVGKVLPDRDACLHEARSTARLIASKSPIAVIGTKVSLNYSQDHSVQDGLDHIRNWNALHLQSEDLTKSVMAQMQKKKPEFSRL